MPGPERDAHDDGERLFVPRPLTENDYRAVVSFCLQMGIGVRHHLLAFRTFDALGRAFQQPEFPANITQIFGLIGLSSSSAACGAYKDVVDKKPSIRRPQAQRAHELALGWPLLSAVTGTQIDVVPANGSSRGLALKAGLKLPHIGVLPVEIGRAFTRSDRTSMIDRCVVTLRNAGFDVPVYSANEDAVNELIRSRALAKLPWVARVARTWYPPDEVAGHDWSFETTADPASIADVMYTTRGTLNVMLLKDGRRLLAHGPTAQGNFYVCCYQPSSDGSYRAAKALLRAGIADLDRRDDLLIGRYASERLAVNSEKDDQYYVFTRMMLLASSFELWRDARANALLSERAKDMEDEAQRSAQNDTEDDDAKEGRR
ncbi:MAG TPA: hypothetical protein VKB25_05280 [Conexibacter sp.]|nr:hypothetical protein [Conexibacter sp.]